MTNCTSTSRVRRLLDYAATEALSDAQVHAWLTENAPDVARGFASETRRMIEQGDRELPFRAPSKFFNCPQFDTSDSSFGTPFADLINPVTHWAVALFPCCGSVEICRLASVLLTPQESECLTLALVDGLSPEAIGLRVKSRQHTPGQTGANWRTVHRRLQSARAKLFQAFQDGRLPKPKDDKDPQKFWESLMQIPPAYRKPNKKQPVKAYVCDCGAHLKLDNQFLDHRKVDSSIAAPRMKGVVKERTLNCRCGRKYTEAQWSSIIA